jgi:hypothetical protein
MALGNSRAHFWYARPGHLFYSDRQEGPGLGHCHPIHSLVHPCVDPGNHRDAVWIINIGREPGFSPRGTNAILSQLLTSGDFPAE